MWEMHGFCEGHVGSVRNMLVDIPGSPLSPSRPG